MSVANLPPVGFIDPNFPNPNGPHDASIIIYGYIPRFSLCLSGIVLFSLVATVHGAQVLRYRAWYFLPLFVACLMEIVGYIFRVLSSRKDPYSIIYFVCAYFFIVVAPVLVSASIYVCLTKFITYAEERGAHFRSRLLKKKFILWTFITADVICTVVQIAGAALIGNTTSKGKSPKIPNDILLAGLATQTFFFAIYLSLLATFILALCRDAALMAALRRIKPFLAALGIASLLVFTRTIFRLVETSQGVFGYLSSHEDFFAGLEFAPMVLALLRTTGAVRYKSQKLTYHFSKPLWLKPTKRHSKEQESASHHPMIPVVDHTSIFCCKVPPGVRKPPRPRKYNMALWWQVKYVIKMNCPRTSNQERTKWRTECREKLANHICSQLGLAILPIDIKLITKPKDLYQWNILTAREAALFNKQLSKYLTGAYIDLCNGVGVHFKAVLRKGAADYDPEMQPIATFEAIDAPEKSGEYLFSNTITFQLSTKEWRERFNVEVAKREALEIEMIGIKGENVDLLTEMQALRKTESTWTQDLEISWEILTMSSHIL
ncbi:hypothetical protein V497_01229 [Pseudogymnoascus sp. VKM F-4516 (FW-969)]|nr:hypothetical protein V497_01229 [Pseudogymnoascus sp. VKM F-4516 (FW-969)]